MRSLILALVLSLSGAAAAEPPRYDRAAQLLARGRASAEVGDTLSSLAYYRDAIAVAPRRSDGYVALGEAYLALAEPARALEVLLAGARGALPSESLWLALNQAYLALGDDVRALTALRQLRRALPDSTRGLRALAEQATKQGLFLEALAARRSLLALTREPEQRAQVRALELLLGGADLVSSRASCSGESAVERALARCPR